MWEGGCGQDGVEQKLDNCNSIINKYIKTNKKEAITSPVAREESQKIGFQI